MLPYKMDLMVLWEDAVRSCKGLRTLALCGPKLRPRQYPGLTPRPVPAEVSQLTALSSLMVHNAYVAPSSDGLPAMPQLRQLSLFCAADGSDVAMQHHFSNLAGLKTMQVRACYVLYSVM